jgi:hypothetical protein
MGKREEKLRKKAKINYTKNNKDKDIPAITPRNIPRKTPIIPSIIEIAAYYKETIRANTNVTLLITILLNDTIILVEII